MNRIEHLGKRKSNSLYWQCQLIGWGIVSTYWAYTVFSRDNFGYVFTILNYALDILLGILVTHSYKLLAIKLKWNSLSLSNLLIRIVPSILILSLVYMLIANLKLHYFAVLLGVENLELWESLISWDPVLITGLRLLSIWLLAYHLYHYYQKQIRTAEQNAELSVIAKQAQLDNLSAQLNPHFLFNSLNSIKSLVIENPKIARRAVDLLSDILRSSLYEKDHSLITIKNELELVKDYVELEKVRFEERLNISITMDSALEDIMIPPLSIQLLVENAIKHGIDKRIKGGSILLSITKNEERVQIMVQNPGILIDSDSDSGLGLKNLTKRLLIQYNGDASFELKQETEDQVMATLLIPISAK